MEKSLVVVESPAKAKTIRAKYLGQQRGETGPFGRGVTANQSYSALLQSGYRWLRTSSIGSGGSLS